MAYWKSLPVEEIPVGGFRGLDESLSATTRPLGVVSAISNLVVSKGSALVTRPGLTAVGTAIAAGVTRGVFRYRNLAGTTDQLLAQAGAQLSRWDGSAWVSISGARPNTDWTAATLNDVGCIFHAGSAAQSWDGAALGVLGGSPPQGGLVVEAYEQLFVAGIPTREGDVDFCDVAAPTTWTPAATNDAGSITVSVNPIKWLGFDRVTGKVTFWTTRELIVLNGPDSPNRPGLWAVQTVAPYGTPVGRSVQNVGGTWIWLTDSIQKQGFAMWSGGSVTVVEEPIKSTFALIDWANVGNGTSWVDLDGRYWCSLPKSGGTIWFCYDPQYQTWLTGTGGDMRASGSFVFSGHDTPLVGSSTGQIYRVEGTDDAGSAISWSVDIGPSALGNTFYNKQLLDVRVALSLASGATASAALSTAESGSYGTSRSITASTTFSQKQVIVPFASGESTRGEVLRVRTSGSGVVTLHDLLMRVYQGRA